MSHLGFPFGGSGSCAANRTAHPTFSFKRKDQTLLDPQNVS